MNNNLKQEVEKAISALKIRGNEISKQKVEKIIATLEKVKETL